MKKKIVSLLFILFLLMPVYSNEYEQIIEELTIELEESNEYIERLEEENKNLENQLEETTNELENSTELISNLTLELAQAQNEIRYFRTSFQELLLDRDDRNLAFGLGVSHPLGGEFIVSIIPPIFDTIQFYGRAGVNEETLFHGGAGIMLRF